MQTNNSIKYACLLMLAGVATISLAQETNLPGSVSSTNTQLTGPKLNAAKSTTGNVQVKEVPSQKITIGQAGIAYPIQEVKFQGNAAIETSVLKGLIKTSKYGALGKLTFAQMVELTEVITDFYRSRGFMVAKALIPEQDITNGQLTILILEGRLDNIRVKAENNQVAEKVKRVLAEQLSSNSAIQKKDVYRAISIASEATGEVIQVNLEASQKLGGTSIEAGSEPLPAYYGSMVVDNFGVPSVGQYNFTGNLGFNSLLTMGDKLNLLLGTTDQPNLSNRYDVSYQVPLGNDGWSVGARIWKSTYQVGADFSSVQPYGYSQAEGVNADYALLRSENARSDWRFGYNHVNLSENYLSGTVTNPRQIDIVWTDLGGSYSDNLLDKPASTNWLVNFTAGNLSVDPSSYNYATQQGATNYSVISYQYSREQLVDQGFSIFGNVRGQSASTNLDPYQKFNIGGPLAVRAYPVGEITADDVVLGTLELRYTQPFEYYGQSGYARITAFYDSAWARINHNVLATQTTDNSTNLAGYGVELNVGLGKNFVSRLYVAQVSSNQYGASRIDQSNSRVGVQLSFGF